MIPSGNGLLANFKKTKPHLYQKLTYKMIEKFLKKFAKTPYKKHKVMRQDLNGEELSIGDRILVCTDKEYGWLGYAFIVGETNLSWKIQLDDTTWSNNKRNFEKNPKRILKANG